MKTWIITLLTVLTFGILVFTKLFNTNPAIDYLKEQYKSDNIEVLWDSYPDSTYNAYYDLVNQVDLEIIQHKIDNPEKYNNCEFIVIHYLVDGYRANRILYFNPDGSIHNNLEIRDLYVKALQKSQPTLK